MAKKHWTPVPADLLEDMQRRAGLDDTAAGYRLGVAERTWRRWKERQQVPTRELLAVGELLGYDFAGDGEKAGGPDVLSSLVADLRADLESLRAELGETLEARQKELQQLTASIADHGDRIARLEAERPAQQTRERAP